MNCGIYRIVHLPTGREYIGHSACILQRWNQHRSLLNRGRHHSPYLQNAWAKHGPDEFTFEVIDLCDQPGLIELEQRHFDARKPVFNVAQAAGSRRGIRASDETRARISAAMTGRERSSETCRKLSEALTGRSLSEAHCLNIRASKANVGIETREKLRLAHLGRKASPETRAKMSAARKGKKLSADHRAKIAKRSEETKQKMSVAQLARRQRERQGGY